MRSRILMSVSIALAGAASPKAAHAWGSQGHRIVAEIARRHIRSSTASRIAEILGPDSLPRVANWADEIRSDPAWAFAAPWHYVSIADGSDYAHSEKDPHGDVVVEIGKMEAALRNPSTPMDEKRQDLKFLIHFIGDIHQPLHAGRKEDMGGNAVKVKFFGAVTNLHVVWDSSMIEFTKLSFTEFSDFIDHATSKQIEEWQKAGVDEWTQESVNMRPQVYDMPAAAKDTKEDVPSLSYDYQEKNISSLEQRLLQGGIRLAGRLDSIFSK